MSCLGFNSWLIVHNSAATLAQEGGKFVLVLQGLKPLFSHIRSPSGPGRTTKIQLVELSVLSECSCPLHLGHRYNGGCWGRWSLEAGWRRRVEIVHIFLNRDLPQLSINSLRPSYLSGANNSLGVCRL